MEDKKAVHHEGPNIDVVKHHKDSIPSWDELKYFIRKYYLFLLIIALIPVVLFTLGQQLANRGSAAPRLKLGTGARVGMQAGGGDANNFLCSGVDCKPIGKIECQRQNGYNTGISLECVIKAWNTNDLCYETTWIIHDPAPNDPANNSAMDPNCPRISPTPVDSNKCSPGDEKLAGLDHCGASPDGSKATCSVCQSDGAWSGSWDLDCPDDGRVATTCMNLGKFPTPTSIPYYGGVAPTNPPAVTDVPGGGSGTCQPGAWEAPINCGKRGCSKGKSARCNDDGSGWYCMDNPSLCGSD